MNGADIAKYDKFPFTESDSFLRYFIIHFILHIISVLSVFMLFLRSWFLFVSGDFSFPVPLRSRCFFVPGVSSFLRFFLPSSVT